MPSVDLKHLPMQVKALINDGIYSLYAVRNRGPVAYVLVTNTREVLPLTADGDVVQGLVLDGLEGLELGAPAFFGGLPARPGAMKLNYA